MVEQLPGILIPLANVKFPISRPSGRRTFPISRVPSAAAAGGGSQSVAMGVGYMPNGGEGLAISYRVRLTRQINAVGTFSGNPEGGEVQGGVGVAWNW